MQARTVMRKQGKDRVNNFDSVNLGFSRKEAISEAKRCLKCKDAPCVKACPVGIKMNEYMKLVAEHKFKEAYEKILEDNFFPSVCGRVCPQEDLCEKACVLNKLGQPIAIGGVEAFIGEMVCDSFIEDIERGFEIKKGSNEENKKIEIKHKIENNDEIRKESNKEKTVAIVGSGPSSLSVAFSLASKGFFVTIFEALHEIGGVLTYGIPNFRLPKDIIEKIKKRAQLLGIEIKTNMVIGRTVDIEDLDKEYDAIFLGLGAGLPYFLNIPGEELNNVYSANEFLTRINLMKAHDEQYETPIYKPKNCVVVGGGNVAMDAARCARRLGAKVIVVYRRGSEEIPARQDELENAKEEGVDFSFLTNPVSIYGDEKVESIECVKMELGKPDASGRRRPKVLDGSNFKIDCDCVVIAIGQGPNPLLLDETDLDRDTKGYLSVKDYVTSCPKIFAGGDIISGAATVIKAIADGKKAANKIEQFLR